MAGVLDKTGFAAVMQGTGDLLKLNMQRLWLTGRVLPVGARLWVRHEFQSKEEKPAEVVYCFALPRDSALRRFRISGDSFSVDSELRRTTEAVRAYEEGIEAGSLSSLAREYGDGLVNLTVGNIRPMEQVVVLLELLAGIELHDDGFRFRFPFTLAPSYHPRMRALEVERGQGELELPCDEFEDVILPRFTEKADDLHQVGFDLSVEMGSEIREVASPSHSVRVQRDDPEHHRVMLARESDLPDRDLVLDVRGRSNGVHVLSGVGRDGKVRVAAVIPSHRLGTEPVAARRMVVLLDRSGSMGGAPIAQAKKAIQACLAALAPDDLFGVVAFDNKVESFDRKLVEGTTENRSAARAFLDAIGSRGGTELAAGVEAAAKLLGGEPGDVLILTDGQVFATETVLAKARASGARVHCLGIGSASQDRFLSLLAAQTGGICRFLTPRERVDLTAVDLFASIGRPVARDVKVSLTGVEAARVAPQPASDVFSGTPLMLFGESGSPGEACLQVDWQGSHGPGHLDLPVRIGPSATGEVLRLLQGAKIIADLESHYLRGDRQGAAARREASRVAERLAQLSLEFGLASSEAALVAVVKRAGDVAGEIPKTQVVVVGMPEDTPFSAVFGDRCITGPMTLSLGTRLLKLREEKKLSQGDIENLRCYISRVENLHACGASNGALGGHGFLSGVSFLMREAARDIKAILKKPARLLRRDSPVQSLRIESPQPTLQLQGLLQGAEELLVTLAGLLEADGGMPGDTEELRLASSLAAALCFVQEGTTPRTGPFRVHVDRLLGFLKARALEALGRERAALVLSVLKQIEAGAVPKGDWQLHARRLAAAPGSGMRIGRGVAGERFWSDLASTMSAATAPILR